MSDSFNTSLSLESEDSPLLPGVSKDGKRRDCSITLNNFLWGLLGLIMGMLVMHLRIEVQKNISKPGEIITNIQPFSDDGLFSVYKKFQGIGFQIYTGGAPAFINGEKRQKNPECIHMNHSTYGYSDDGVMQCYLGLKNPEKDMQKRIKVIESAVDRAYDVSDKDNGTLKVFIVPEFFFRGIYGTYPFDFETEKHGCGLMCKLLHELERIVEQEKFKDWLFLFGTVVASKPLPEEEPYDYLFYNFAPLYKGFDSRKDDHNGRRFLVPKRYLSNIDFLTPLRHLNESIAKELIGEEIPSDRTVFNPHDFQRKRYDNERWNEYKADIATLGYTMIEYGWFIMDYITFSVEICFDHDRHSALDTYLANVATGSSTLIPSGGGHGGLEYVKIPEHQAQISLVSSAGMTVTTESLALAHNGTILLQDGLSNETSHKFWEDECPKGLQFDGGSEAIQRFTVLTPTDVFFEYRLHTAYEMYNVYDDDEKWKEEFAGVFSTNVYRPKLTVYDAIPIADVEV